MTRIKAMDDQLIEELTLRGYKVLVSDEAHLRSIGELLNDVDADPSYARGICDTLTILGFTSKELRSIGVE